MSYYFEKKFEELGDEIENMCGKTQAHIVSNIYELDEGKEEMVLTETTPVAVVAGKRHTLRNRTSSVIIQMAPIMYKIMEGIQIVPYTNGRLDCCLAERIGLLKVMDEIESNELCFQEIYGGEISYIDGSVEWEMEDPIHKKCRNIIEVKYGHDDVKNEDFIERRKLVATLEGDINTPESRINRMLVLKAPNMRRTLGSMYETVIHGGTIGIVEYIKQGYYEFMDDFVKQMSKLRKEAN